MSDKWWVRRKKCEGSKKWEVRRKQSEIVGYQ